MNSCDSDLNDSRLDFPMSSRNMHARAIGRAVFYSLLISYLSPSTTFSDRDRDRVTDMMISMTKAGFAVAHRHLHTIAIFFNTSSRR
jgi:hypothetical protein